MIYIICFSFICHSRDQTYAARASCSWSSVIVSYLETDIQNSRQINNIKYRGSLLKDAISACVTKTKTNKEKLFFVQTIKTNK